MINDELKCSQCGFISKKGQNFCGDCGQKLEKACPNCNTANPPGYNFCGECGSDLRLLGNITLNRAGLIVKSDSTANTILQLDGDALLGKPFSIFVAIADRASFFSSWNTTLNSNKQQKLEVELKPTQDSSVNSRLTVTPNMAATGVVETIQLEIEDSTDQQESLEKMAENVKLLQVIGALTELFHPSSRKNRHATISSVLEKIGKASESQYAFISRIDPVSKLLFTEFIWQASGASETSTRITTLPLESIHPVFGKLQNGLSYITKNFRSLSLSEQQLWNRWHPAATSLGAIACELIYRDHHPVGIIGLVKGDKGEWSEDVIMLMNLSARLISETLPKNIGKNAAHFHQEIPAIEDEADYAEDLFNLEEVEIVEDQYELFDSYEPIDGGMLVEPIENGNPDEAHRVFPTDDGVYVLQCPRCEESESIPVDHYGQDGWMLQVSCPCSCTFQIIREMRKAYRKEVQLLGSFSQGSDEMNKLETPGKWSSMEVTNISKIGLNFSTPMSRLLSVGDNVQLKFNLDNSTHSLINKSARIKSVRKNRVGCEFENGNKSDTTLGFYFL